MPKLKMEIESFAGEGTELAAKVRSIRLLSTDVDRC